MAEASEKNLTGEGLAELWELVKARDSKVASDAAAALSGKIVTGTYTGNDAASRTISLGFTPRAVMVVHKSGTMGYQPSQPYAMGGLAVTNGNSDMVAIVSNGFTVKGGSSWSDSANASDQTYIYLVIAF